MIWGCDVGMSRAGVDFRAAATGVSFVLSEKPILTLFLYVCHRAYHHLGERTSMERVQEGIMRTGLESN